MNEWTRRRFVQASSAATIGALAGCSGLGSGSTSTPTESEETQTSSPTTTQTTDESGKTPGYIEYHWHGKLFMDVDGDLVDFTQPKYYLDNIDRQEAVYFHFHESAHGDNEWSNEKQTVTFAEGLNLLPGIEYQRANGSNVISHEGTTYDGREQGTAVRIYEGTEEIDPTGHQVRHGENYWIHVDTGSGSSNGSEGDDGARTGKLLVDVNNRRLNFADEYYRSESTDQFGFHDDGNPYQWYNEGEAVTLQTALNTLPNIEYSQGDGGKHVIEYNTGESYTGTYRDAAEATEILVRRRAKPLDPTQYELQDGDVIWVYVHTSEAPDNEH